MTTPLQAFRAEEARHQVVDGFSKCIVFCPGLTHDGASSLFLRIGTREQCQDWITERALEAALSVRLREMRKQFEAKAPLDDWQKAFFDLDIANG